jgi:hypothetical protein
VVIELWAVEAFCRTPVIACLFFVASVLSMLEMQHPKVKKMKDIYIYIYIKFAEDWWK